MPWDRLFDDLELQLDDESRLESAVARVEEERLRLGRLELRTRLVGIARGETESAIGALRLELRNGVNLVIHATTFGRDWLAGRMLDTGADARQGVVPFEAISAVIASRHEIDVSLRDVPPAPVADRIGLPFVLRDLCRRRAAVSVMTDSGEIHGTIDRVGKDHLDLAVHDRGRLRREPAVSHYRIIPLARVLTVVTG